MLPPGAFHPPPSGAPFSVASLMQSAGHPGSRPLSPEDRPGSRTSPLGFEPQHHSSPLPSDARSLKARSSKALGGHYAAARSGALGEKLDVDPGEESDVDVEGQDSGRVSGSDSREGTPDLHQHRDTDSVDKMTASHDQISPGK